MTEENQAELARKLDALHDAWEGKSKQVIEIDRKADYAALTAPADREPEQS
jgi:hypothetical protein